MHANEIDCVHFIFFQTAKPQERNPFVKTQKNQEQRNKSVGNAVERISTNTKGLESEEAEAEKDTVVADSQKLKDPSSNKEEKEKRTASSVSTNDSSPSTDTNNNDPTLDRKRGYSVTEDQKEQLLSLLASGKLNKTSSVTENNEQKTQEPTKQGNEAVKDHPVKPSSPSLSAYPQFAQTEAHMMFSPITPAGRSASPSVHSDISDSQIPVVPNFVPVPVPIPSVAPVPMPSFWYMPQGGMMPYPQPAMSPVQYVPADPSMASNRSVASTDSSDVSKLSDVDPRSKKTTSAIPRFDKKTERRGPTLEKDIERRSRCTTALQNNKASKLPRPIWQIPVTKSRANPVESETNSNVVRRRTPIADEFNERTNEVKPVRARTPSPSLGRRSSPKVTTPPRSQTPPVYWNREGVDIPANELQKRVSTGSFPSWRPSSPSSSPDARRRSSSSPSRSRSDSPLQKPRGSSSRPSSPSGSRSNSPVSILVSKFEQMSKESSANAPRARSTSVSSMISKFGPSSLVPEDRMVKGQFKPNMNTASAAQPSSKTGPFRPSVTRDRASDHEPTNNSISSYENPISSRGRNRSRTSMSSDDDELSLINNSVDPREVQRSGSDPGSNGNGSETLFADLRCPLSSSLGNLHKASQGSTDRCQDSRTRLLETITKWSSQKDIMQDGSTAVVTRSVQERSISGLSLIDNHSTKKELLDEKDSAKARTALGTTSCFAPSRGRSSSSSSELTNESIIKPNDKLHNVLKPWQTKDGFSTKLGRKSSLDSEPVREKGSPKSRPRDICIIPERDNSMQYCDIKSPKDFLWSPTSDTHKFEIPVDLAVLESTTPTVSSPLNAVCGLDLPYAGRDGSVLSPAAPLSPGSLKDFKPSNYFTSVTFKCGEMEPERDTNCLRKAPSRESTGVSSNTVTNRRDPNVNYVRRFERKILRSTGDIEDEAYLSNSGSDRNQSVTSINETKNNPRRVTRTPANQDSSAAKGTSSDSKILKSSSKTDPALRSRQPSGDGPSLTDGASASTSKNSPSPMTLKKLISNPLPREDNTSRTRPSTSKRNSLPTSQPINLLSNLGAMNGPMKKSSSQTNVSSRQKQVRKSSSQTNLSPRQIAGDLLPNSSSKGPGGKGNPHSKSTSSNNPHSKEDEIKGKRLETNANPSSTSNPHPSKERQASSKEHYKERNPHSSNSRRPATKTQSVTPGASRNSESNAVRYPYTRRSSTPGKASTTTKPPPKAASNPASPLYPKQSNDILEFFVASSTYPGNPRGSISQGNPKSDHMNFALKGAQHHGKPRQRTQSSGESFAASSGVGSSPMASPPGSFSTSSSTFALPSRAQVLEKPSSVDNPSDSDVFYVPYSGETLPKSEQTSVKTTTKRFPSSSSSDSGLNMSDPDETRKGSGKGNKTSRVSSPPISPNSLSPSHLPLPTSPKFPIGSNIFYEPRDQQTNFSWPDKGSSDAPKEPRNLGNVSLSGQENAASNPLKSSPTKSTDSPDKTARSNSDKFKNRKGEVSKMQDKISVDANERFNSLPEKPKDIITALKTAAAGEIVRSTSKERLASSTPPPDLLGRRSSKSPPSSSRVDSKELLGQLVKKVLNSAAAKQGSSPKASFVESPSSAERDNGKGRGASQGKMFFLPEETKAVEEKETSHPKNQTKRTDSSNQEQRVLNADRASTKKDQGDKSAARKRDNITSDVSAQSVPAVLNEAPISPRNASKIESSPPQVS